MNLEGLNKEELKELKMCINTMISERLKYTYIETNEERLKTNKKFLDMDYELLRQVIEVLENE